MGEKIVIFIGVTIITIICYLAEVHLLAWLLRM